MNGQDIFRSLLAEASLTRDYPDRQREHYNHCSLCGDKDGHVCSGCANLLTQFTRKQKLTLHKRLKDLGDKDRADILSVNFEVFAREESQVAKTRRNLGLTKAAMARKLGLSPARYAPVERGDEGLTGLAKQRFNTLSVGV